MIEKLFEKMLDDKMIEKLFEKMFVAAYKLCYNNNKTQDFSRIMVFFFKFCNKQFIPNFNQNEYGFSNWVTYSFQKLQSSEEESQYVTEIAKNYIQHSSDFPNFVIQASKDCTKLKAHIFKTLFQNEYYDIIKMMVFTVTTKSFDMNSFILCYDQIIKIKCMKNNFPCLKKYQKIYADNDGNINESTKKIKNKIDLICQNMDDDIHMDD